MSASDPRDGTLAAVPPALVGEVSRAFAACTESAGCVEGGDVRALDSAVLESNVLAPDALLDAGVHALARVVALDCSTRAAALPLLAADALVTRAMELAAHRYRDSAELRDFAERAMLRLGASSLTRVAAVGAPR